MSERDCKICGWTGLRVPHHGVVDCIAAYRAYTEELRGLLPQGRQVILGTIDRESTVRIWIEGPITHFGLERIKKYVEFIQEAFGLDPNSRCAALEMVSQSAESSDGDSA